MPVCELDSVNILWLDVGFQRKETTEPKSSVEWYLVVYQLGTGTRLWLAVSTGVALRYISPVNGGKQKANHDDPEIKFGHFESNALRSADEFARDLDSFV